MTFFLIGTGIDCGELARAPNSYCGSAGRVRRLHVARFRIQARQFSAATCNSTAARLARGPRTAQGCVSFLQQRSVQYMDSEPESEREVTRVPTDVDLVSLARELNRLGVAYVVVA